MGGSPSKGEITGTSWFLLILWHLKLWFFVHKNGPVTQIPITSVTIVARLKCYSYTEGIFAILVVCLNIFYCPPGPRHPPVNFLYIMAYLNNEYIGGNTRTILWLSNWGGGGRQAWVWGLLIIWCFFCSLITSPKLTKGMSISYLSSEND